ncbi:MAG: flagellar hook-basal body complex protein FliE [Thermodesulfobacteria bacterium]|nr:flagellar hook-basal body complex protein FliE [Thermodesulfobacteriota bacterium]
MAEIRNLQQTPGAGLIQGAVQPGDDGSEPSAKGFKEMVEEGLEKLNSQMTQADELAARLAAGEELDIPEVMVALSKADISFRMFVQVRNKALSAYEEIMRLQF